MINNLHHIGYAVPDIGKAICELSALGWKARGSETDDVKRQVRIAFMELNGLLIELVSPLSTGSPIYKFLQKGCGSLYHLCYAVDSIADAERELKDAGFLPFRKAAPAPAIEGRCVEFMFSKSIGVIELVEKCKKGDAQ